MKERLETIARSPGVYLMKDGKGTVIYVGKAKNLRARVSSYFRGGDGRATVKYLVALVKNIETVVTESERQALLLEADLIRKFKPRYNIRLKDDKAHYCVRIDPSAPWPRIELVRKVQDDGAIYLGPFAFGYELRTMLDVIKRTLPLRTCADTVLNNRVRPCLEYQIKRCSGPCCLPVDRALYGEWVDRAIKILQGRDREVTQTLQEEMNRASEELRFEDAAEIRDRLHVLTKMREEAPAGDFSYASQDAFAIYREEGRAEVVVLLVRRGRIVETKDFGFAETVEEDDELLGEVLGQYYGGGAEIPSEVLLPFELEDADVREEILTERRGQAMKLVVPKIGPKMRLVTLAEQNARENFAARFGKSESAGRISVVLQRELRLENAPNVIECADVSHFQGGSTVGSVVCFEDGRPEKSRYRRFILSQEGKPDDFASMREIMTRHLSRCAEENTLPDLLVIDGGPQQLQQALDVKKELGLLQPEVVSLAKKRTLRVPYRMMQRSKESFAKKKPERVFRPGEKEPIVLRPESDALKLLERLRDEAHRFAITFHRQRRTKKTFRTALEGIQGVGPKRQLELLRAYGSVKAIARANPEELSERCKISLGLAQRIVETLQRRTSRDDSESS